MSIRALTRVACASVLLAGLLAGTAHAQVFDKRTTFSFRTPTSVPGVTLPPGEYQVRVADAYTRDVVQVLSADGRKPYALFFALPVWRPDPASDSELHFMETAAGMPQAVKTWFYVGESTGYEFVYPREQARRLAMGTGERVATTNVWPGDVARPDFSWITPQGEESPYDDHDSAAFEPTGPALQGQLAANAPVIDTTPAPREALPRTDSATAWRLAGGALLLIGAVFLRRARTQLT
jgi:hypothetical protein